MGKMLASVSPPMARLIIRSLLLLAILITVISMITLDLSGDPAEPSSAAGGTTTEANRPEESNNENGGNGESGEPGENGEEGPGEPTPIPTEPPAPQAPVTSVAISWRFQQNNVNEMTLRIGDTLDVWANVFPVDADVDIHWETANPTVVNFTVNADNLREIELEARGAGQTIVTVTAGGHTDELIVRVW